MRIALPKISKSLLPAKAAYFFFYFSYSSVTPFIVVFMTAKGLNAEQAGFVLGGRLFAQFVSGPCWGAIADKTRRYRLVLLLQIVISSVLTFTAPWIPNVLPQATNKGSQSNTISTTPQGIPFTNHVNTTLPTDLYSGALDKVTTITARNESNITTTFILSTAGDQPNITTPSSSLYPTSAGDKDHHRQYKQTDTQKLFILMIVWFALIGAFDGGIPILIDNSVMDTVAKKGKSDFGKQRLWGAVGFGLAAFASGVGIELSGGNEPNYETMFYIFLGSNSCLLLASSFLPMQYKKSESPFFQTVLKEFKKFHVIFFFLTILIMGIANGLLYGFIFLYIQDLNGSKIIMGLSILVASSTEVMMFPVSSRIIRIMKGNMPAITLAFSLYVVRFLGYSFLVNAWFILLLQLLHSICFALFWAAAVYHTSSLAPKGLQATFLGIMNGIFFGIAGGASSVFGGMVYNHFGGRKLYRGFAVVLGIWTVFLVLHMLERHQRKIAKAKEAALEMEQRNDLAVPAAEKLLASNEA